MAIPVIKVKGMWEGRSAGGSMSSPTWRYNPQVFISSATEQDVNITLAQDIKTKWFIGLTVAKSNGKISRQLALHPDQIVHRSEFEQNQTVKMTVHLEPTVTYVVIPSTFEPSEVGRYMLTFAGTAELIVSELPSTEEWKYVSLKGEWKDKSAGGCISQSTFGNNPQFVLKAEVPTHALVLLTQSGENRDALGFYVFETKTVKTKMNEFLHDDLRASAEFVRVTEATCEFDMQPRKVYCIIPCTYEPSKENPFELTVFSDNEIKLHELKPGGKD